MIEKNAPFSLRLKGEDTRMDEAKIKTDVIGSFEKKFTILEDHVVYTEDVVEGQILFSPGSVAFYATNTRQHHGWCQLVPMGLTSEVFGDPINNKQDINDVVNTLKYRTSNNTETELNLFIHPQLKRTTLEEKKDEPKPDTQGYPRSWLVSDPQTYSSLELRQYKHQWYVRYNPELPFPVAQEIYSGQSFLINHLCMCYKLQPQDLKISANKSKSDDTLGTDFHGFIIN